MDVNEYMSKSLGLLERIAEGVEALNERGIHVTNFVLPEGTDLKVVGDVAHAQPSDKVEKKADPKSTTSAATADAAKTSGASSQTGVSESEEKTAPTPQKKRATADDARKALKAYAAIEGNAAAMELLTSIGGASVSALQEASTDEDDKLAELIAKCGG